MAATRYGELRDQIFRQSFPNIYAPAILRDADSQYHPLPISERLVQCIWYDQRLTAGLTTTDGRPVAVIFPGWWNLEAGPDFHHATVKVGDDPEVTGAIEVHLRAEDWMHHGHARDPLYDNVVLHVVLWEAGSQTLQRTRLGDAIPQIVLQNQLAAPIEQLYDEIDLDAYPHNVGNHAGRCAATLADLPDSEVATLLDSAGDERFAGKTRRFARWIQRLGPEQAFYEGWMEALGYKANKTAFRTLAQRLPITESENARSAAIFFGVAGFLPIKQTDAYGKRLWKSWWKLRPDYADRQLPKETWRLTGIRPANHPHRRLGAAVALLKRHPNLADKVIAAIESDGDPAKLFLQVRDDYWQHHFTLGGQPQAKPQELIGATRAAEIVANIVLPFVAAHEPRLASQVKDRYAALRPASDNAIVRLAGEQLFAKAAVANRHVKTTRQQQGLIQIFQDFCLNDKSACRLCQFPELVRRWASGD
ncbi:MAG: hypothetical protein PCFJNLEI_03900 [Verrucomicrobiae bacterium]|nr:hypothetical protein [Verrucomicrobiae bacterium]